MVRPTRSSSMSREVEVDKYRNRFDPHVRGHHSAYRSGEQNRCPGCDRSHWYIGRSLAECAFCATAIPLVAA